MITKYNPTAEFARAIFAPETSGEKIRAYFKSGHADAVYSASMLALLETDPGVECVTSEETGEILYMAEN